jgi:hypothetical protein
VVQGILNCTIQTVQKFAKNMFKKSIHHQNKALDQSSNKTVVLVEPLNLTLTRGWKFCLVPNAAMENFRSF